MVTMETICSLIGNIEKITMDRLKLLTLVEDIKKTAISKHSGQEVLGNEEKAGKKREVKIDYNVRESKSAKSRIKAKPKVKNKAKARS